MFPNLGLRLRRTMESIWNITLLNTKEILVTVARTKLSVPKVFWIFSLLNDDDRLSWLNKKWFELFSVFEMFDEVK